jgi:hypothetical protein
MAQDNGWNEWSKHVLAELERLNDCYNGVNGQLQKIHVEIAMLKVKSGIWGAIGGCIPLLITVIMYLVSKH